MRNHIINVINAVIILNIIKTLKFIRKFNILVTFAISRLIK